ncbi:unnamed protein product [Boreogadus saida]
MVPESDDEGEKKKRKRKKSSARKASDGSAAESDAESKKKKTKEEGQALVDFSIKVCQAKESGEFRPANTIIDREQNVSRTKNSVQLLTDLTTSVAVGSMDTRSRMTRANGQPPVTDDSITGWRSAEQENSEPDEWMSN